MGSPPLTLVKRRDFLACAAGTKAHLPAFTLQARQRNGAEPAGSLRVGYTCSKKLGNAVARNRAKRRLREAARAVLPLLGRPGWDYVLVGRPGETAARAFPAMIEDLRRAVDLVHKPGKRSNKGARG